jgi:hypothetical protein
MYRNSSALPQLCASLGLNGTVTDASDDVQFGCPECVASMRLISITGGRQMHLMRHLTHYRDVISQHHLLCSCRCY